MTDDTEKMAAIRRLAYKPPVTLELTAFEAWCLMALAQLGMRHPSTDRNMGAMIAKGAAEKIRYKLCADDPVLNEVALDGYDPRHDK